MVKRNFKMLQMHKMQAIALVCNAYFTRRKVILHLKGTYNILLKFRFFVCLYSNSSAAGTVFGDLINRWSPNLFGLTCWNPMHVCSTNQILEIRFMQNCHTNVNKPKIFLACSKKDTFVSNSSAGVAPLTPWACGKFRTTTVAYSQGKFLTSAVQHHFSRKFAMYSRAEI